MLDAGLDVSCARDSRHCCLAPFRRRRTARRARRAPRQTTSSPPPQQGSAQGCRRPCRERSAAHRPRLGAATILQPHPKQTGILRPMLATTHVSCLCPDIQKISVPTLWRHSRTESMRHLASVKSSCSLLPAAGLMSASSAEACSDGLIAMPR